MAQEIQRVSLTASETQIVAPAAPTLEMTGTQAGFSGIVQNLASGARTIQIAEPTPPRLEKSQGEVDVLSQAECVA